MAGALLGSCTSQHSIEPIYLPTYALGLTMREAMNVVPITETRNSWVLRCAGEPEAPAGLRVSQAEARYGVMRCWPMQRGTNGETRSAHPMRRASLARQEIEFVNNRIVRIKTVRLYAPKGAMREVRTDVANDRAREIDALQAPQMRR